MRFRQSSRKIELKYDILDMKKHFLISSLVILPIILLASGCVYRQEPVTQEKTAEPNVAIEEPKEKQPVVPEGDFYATDDAIGGYLWHGTEKLLDGETIADWLGGDNYNAGIWFQRDEGDQVYLYFSSGSDCGGCSIHEDDYMVIDKKTNKIIRKEIEITDRSTGIAYGIFRQGNGTGVLSPDKTKVVYVSKNAKNDQSVYVHYFKERKIEEKIMDIPHGQIIAENTPNGFFLLDKKSLLWDETTGKPIVGQSAKRAK